MSESSPAPPDAASPVVTILGNADLAVMTGSDFTDPGATAVDADNAPLSVCADGHVDVSTPGVYQILYSATDSRGRTATAIRRVTVVYRNSGESLWNITLGAY